MERSIGHTGGHARQRLSRIVPAYTLVSGGHTTGHTVTPTEHSARWPRSYVRSERPMIDPIHGNREPNTTGSKRSLEVRGIMAQPRTHPDLHLERSHRERDMKALITNGRHMETILRESIIPILQIAESVPGLDGDEHTDLLKSCETAVYEWDKRARRNRVDWWNR